jgi:2-dehydro-3-deoxygluconokinase
MIVAFGEVMARIAPPERRRWRQTLPGMVEVTWGGGEANVCAALAMWGAPARYVTALPRNPLAESLVASLRGLGIETNSIVWRAGRLGLYFVEVGANQRGSTVLYDRDASAVSLAQVNEYDFDRALADVHWLHVTGITPAISETAFQVNLEIVRRAKSSGAMVSCDLNFRKKLWRWRSSSSAQQLARECMAEVLPYTDVVIANEEDAADVLDIHARGTDVAQGRIDAGAYVDVARQIVARFANVSYVAVTLRESISADHNNWGGMLYDARNEKAHFAPIDEHGAYRPYEIRNIVDRIGAGDSFAAGIVYGLDATGRAAPEDAIQLAVAASCLKHSIHGDFAYVSMSEIQSLAAGNATGRVQR